MDQDDWSSSGEGSSDSEPCSEDGLDKDHSMRKLQIRKIACKARWDETMGMAEIVERKGKMLVSTGIIRNGKIYCLIEEALFLAELGALIIVDDGDAALPLRDMYGKVARGQSGCNWDAFQVYRHLKSFDYVVGRHGVPWSLKSKVDPPSQSLEDDIVGGKACKEEKSIVDMLSDLQINEGKIVFDVYRPNSQFRKSSPGDPIGVISLAGSRPPTNEEIEDLERQCNNIPLLFANNDHGRVTFFRFKKVELDVLP